MPCNMYYNCVLLDFCILCYFYYLFLYHYSSYVMYSLYSIFIFLILFFSITIKWVLFSVLFYTNYDIPSLCMHLYFTFAIIIKCVYLPSYLMFILCLFLCEILGAYNLSVAKLFELHFLSEKCHPN